jgi:hypothetical protein
MFKLTVVAVLALIPFVASQATELQIDTVEAHFEASRIVPTYFEDFDPKALLNLDYTGIGSVQPGRKVVKEEVNSAPTVTVTPEQGEQLTGLFTLAMIDLDIVGADISAGVTRHWLLNGVTVDSATGAVSNATATAITPYAGPWPAAGSGPHRYVVALYEQPSDFAAPEGFTGELPVGVFDFKKYVADAKLGDLVAANFIEVEEGTATVSLVSTTTVNTATLTSTGATVTTTGAGSNGGNGGTTGTGNSGANNADNSNNGAVALAISPVAAAVVAGLTFLAL